MIRTCPQCKKIYQTVLDESKMNGDERLIQDIYPNASPIEREQLKTGICSEECWDKFLGVETCEIDSDDFPEFLMNCDDDTILRAKEELVKIARRHKENTPVDVLRGILQIENEIERREIEDDEEPYEQNVN